MPAGILALLLLGFYSWAPSSFHFKWTSARPVGFYNELADAFLAGQTSLLRQPDPRLVALSDPYLPELNAPYRVNDLSYFRGRYYLYMGAAPVVAVFLPFRAVTGRYLTHEAAATLFCAAGAWAGVGLVLLIRRRLLTASPWMLLTGAVLALCLANGFHAVVQGGLAQHVAIAAAYAFVMVALWSLAHALTAERHPLPWFSLAGLALGAAIASRPNYVFASCALLPPVFAGWRRAGAARTPGLWSRAAAACLPLGAVVALVLAYNATRFGRPLEFGIRYQLGGWDQRHLAYSATTSALENAWRYLLAPGRVSGYFPFMRLGSWMATGVLTCVPWLWLGPWAVWALLRKGAPGALRALGASSIIVGACNLLTLIFLPSGNEAAVLTSANERYIVDFLPALTLFVALGALAAGEPGIAGSRPRSRLLSPLALLLAAASALISLSIDFQRFPTDSYAPLARILNGPSYLASRLRGDAYGPIDAEIVFPRGRTGSYEPIVSTGTPEAGDLLYVNYASPSEVRLGFVGTEFAGKLGDPISVDYSAIHRIEVAMGSLYPEEGHPAWSGLNERQAAFRLRNLHVRLDGVTVLDMQVPFHASAPAQVRLGATSILGSYSGAQFSGRIVGSGRLPVAPPPEALLPAGGYGALKLRIRLPLQRAAGTREPVVVTGVPRAGDFVYVEYLQGEQVRFGLDHWGASGIASEPVRVDSSSAHSLEISMGSLFPTGARSAVKDRTRISLDGATLLDADQATYDSSPYDVSLGRNTIGGSTCAYEFTGQILGSSRDPVPE